MSRDLISKTNILIICLVIVGGILFITSIWYVAIPLCIGVLFLISNSIVRTKLISSYLQFSPRREIKKYNTIVIGDFIKNSCIDLYCDNYNTLFVTSPERTIEASFQILQHMTSCIDAGGTCVIVDANLSKNVFPYSLFDYPFISYLRKKELKIEFLDKQLSLPLFYEPLKSLKILFKCPSDNYVQKKCHYQDIVNLCNKKGFNLIYLVKDN